MDACLRQDAAGVPSCPVLRTRVLRLGPMEAYLIHRLCSVKQRMAGTRQAPVVRAVSMPAALDADNNQTSASAKYMGSVVQPSPEGSGQRA